MDLVQVSRVAAAVERRGQRFTRRILAREEVQTRPQNVALAVWIASCFAAKEACLKALGTGWASGVAFPQVRVGENGTLSLHGQALDRAKRIGVGKAHCSMKVEGDMVAALVMLVG